MGVERLKGELPVGEIERMADVWGERRLRRDLRRERLPKRGPVIRIVDKETLDGPLTWPKLVKEDRRLASLRFGPLTGEVAVPFWREMEVEQDANGRYLPFAEDYVQLTTGKERKLNLRRLPDRPVRQLIMKKSPDLETAIRQAFHVNEEMLGKENEQLGIIWREIMRVWDQVLDERITEKNLDELAFETALVLADSGLTSAKKIAKRNIFQRMLGVYQKDSLGKFNPLAQRTRLRSAYLEAIGLEAFSVLVREKFTAVAGVLLMEREITRQSLEDAAKALDTMMGFGKRGAAIFEGSEPHKGELEGIDVALKGVVLLLSRPRVAPYLQIARTAGIALWGGQPKYLEENRAIIGDEKAHVLLDPNFVPVRDLIRKGEFSQAKSLVKSWIYDEILALQNKTEMEIELK